MHHRVVVALTHGVAATMEEHDYRVRPRRIRGPVDANRDLRAVVGGDLAVFDLGHLGHVNRRDLALFHLAAHLLGGDPRRMELDAQRSLQGILRRWLIFHVPAAGLLMGLITVHIVSFFLY